VLAEHGLLNFFIRGEQVFFANHRSDIERFAHEIAERDVRPELEVYSAAMLEEVQHLLGLGILSPPYVINFVFHTPTQGGTAGRPRTCSTPWRGCGRSGSRGGSADQRHIDGPDAAADDHDRHGDGLNVRVGMEDNVLYRLENPCARTRSWWSAACGSPPSSTGDRPPPAQAREPASPCAGRPAGVGRSWKPAALPRTRAPGTVAEAVELLAAGGARGPGRRPEPRGRA
jgi:3-keto-5-aminohexanoate cleavage enzyme